MHLLPNGNALPEPSERNRWRRQQSANVTAAKLPPNPEVEENDELEIR